MTTGEQLMQHWLRCNLVLDVELKLRLTTITGFNLEARYDDIKEAFYKMCTKEFADDQIAIIKEIREWLKKKLTTKC